MPSHDIIVVGAFGTWWSTTASSGSPAALRKGAIAPPSTRSSAPPRATTERASSARTAAHFGARADAARQHARKLREVINLGERFVPDDVPARDAD